MRKFSILFLCLLLAVGMAVCVSAEEQQAVDITDETKLSGTGYADFSFLKNKNVHDYQKSFGNAAIVLENPEGIASLYLLLDFEYGEYIVRDNETGKELVAGRYGFLHEFLDLEAAFETAPTSVTLEFSNGGAYLSEIYVFSSGITPDFVQKWEPPLDGKADILMLPTHGDDDHLFFAGLLPYYAGELDCNVQVAYLSNHRSYTTVRTHEILNGLWVTGVENYPVFGFPMDFIVYDLQDCYNIYESKYDISRAELLGFAVEIIRRFQPQVVVAHDVKGEYGHGMHLVYTDITRKAVEISADPQQYPELAQKYGVWDVPKTYLHLWPENPVEINYDIPLESFDGMTAFQVSQKLGFPCHVSQQIYPMFVEWINGPNGEVTKATQLKDYNPCKFGLYRSTVGEDVQKNDFLENIVTYGEQARIEQERIESEIREKERLERVENELKQHHQDRLEEQARLEQERLAQEQAEQERLEQERLEQERLKQEELDRAVAEVKRNNRITLLCLVVVFLGGSSLASKFTQKQFAKKKSLGGGKKVKK